MALAGDFLLAPPRRMWEARPERILYGTHFPNVPSAWDRELRPLLALKLGDAAEAALLGRNALRLYEGC